MGDVTDMVPRPEDVHVYPQDEEELHTFKSGECPCAPEAIIQGQDDGVVFVHRRLRA